MIHINLYNADEGVITKISGDKIGVTFKDGSTHFCSVKPNKEYNENSKELSIRS